MLHDAPIGPDDNLELDGQSISEIIAVGRVIGKTEETMRTVFEINDNTGSFKIIFYQKDTNQVPTALKGFEYKQFSYVKVFGNIRVYKEDKAIVGTHIKRISKFDELTNHFLQTFVAQSVRLQGVLPQKDLGG
jgi:RPA family protein